MPDKMSDRVPEDMPDRMPEDLPDRMPEDMPEDMPDRMSEDMPDRMANRMSEDMSDRMPEDLPVRKCINVMVGITRSKVILFLTLCDIWFCFQGWWIPQPAFFKSGKSMDQPYFFHVIISSKEQGMYEKTGNVVIF